MSGIIFGLDFSEAEGGGGQAEGGQGDEDHSRRTKRVRLKLIKIQADDGCQEAPEAGEADMGAHI